MSFKGFTYEVSHKKPKRTLNGFYGFKINLDLTGVKVVDSRGKGLSDVKITAENPTSGNTFIGYTDGNGTVFMELDANTQLTIQKNLIIIEEQYNGELSPTYQLDIPIIK
jgi:hypothetical protein